MAPSPLGQQITTLDSTSPAISPRVISPRKMDKEGMAVLSTIGRTMSGAHLSMSQYLQRYLRSGEHVCTTLMCCAIHDDMKLILPATIIHIFIITSIDEGESDEQDDGFYF